MAPPQKVTAQPGSTPLVSTPTNINRVAAVAYARKYWAKTCGDGVLALDFVPTKNVTPEAPFRPDLELDGALEAKYTEDNSGIREDNMEDCTHFTSCCLGQPIDKAAVIAQKLTATWENRATLPRETSRRDAPRPAAGHQQPLCGYVGAKEFVNYLLTAKPPLKRPWGTLVGAEKQDLDSCTLPARRSSCSAT